MKNMTKEEEVEGVNATDELKPVKSRKWRYWIVILCSVILATGLIGQYIPELSVVAEHTRSWVDRYRYVLTVFRYATYALIYLLWPTWVSWLNLSKEDLNIYLTIRVRFVLFLVGFDLLFIVNVFQYLGA